MRWSSCRILTLAAALIATGCAQVEPETLLSAAEYKEYLPIDPMESPTVTFHGADDSAITRPWSNLEAGQIIGLLPNQQAVITTSKMDVTGSAKYVAAGATVGVGVYRFVMDYMQFRVEPLTDANNRRLGTAKVGVGMRVVAQVQTTTADVDLGSLFALGVAARVGAVRGTLTVLSVGIASPDVTAAFPTPSTIDETSIQKALESLAIIKLKIGDPNTRLTPQIVAVRLDDPSGVAAYEPILQ